LHSRIPYPIRAKVPEITSPRNVVITMQQHHHRSTSIALRVSCSQTEEICRRCDEALRAVGVALRVFLRPNAIVCTVLRLGRNSASQKSTNCAIIETESADNLQRTAPWAQTLNALGTTLLPTFGALSFSLSLALACASCG
jgi:hypothetical protein